MKKSSLIAIGLSIGLFNVSAQAGEVDLGLSEHMFSVNLSNNLSKHANVDLGYAYNEEKGHVIAFAAHMTHQNGPHQFAVGPKFIRLWGDESPNGSVVAVGGEYSLYVNNNLSVHASSYYAPSVLTFAKMDGYFEYEAKAQYNLNSNMGLYAGYRHQEFRFESASKLNFADGFYIGGTLKF
ncbi:YfaZ family outer membrane protein [Shewanella intestini]|uniref:Porin n=1 Tax=Shewanella intestini TaxID=2017544 RepID=A0ABS5I049_9GAMM|nr:MULTISPECIES: YfaZ family outer membrane protein [Shewanella]MBR9727402.1 hypothetical protein [Shewanella intestini]MRG35548.1 hypothetical protein [Shewanella sp. XMDDZSB0408]